MKHISRDVEQHRSNVQQKLALTSTEKAFPFSPVSSAQWKRIEVLNQALILNQEQK